MNLLCRIGLHKWFTVKWEVYRDSMTALLGITESNRERKCLRCGKHQELDIHCLGVNPPDYQETWRTK